MESLDVKNKNINKKEFVLKLECRCKLGKNQVEKGLDGILNFFSTAFKKECVIEMRGFGKFICKNGKVRFKSFVKL
jgi:nucleoid DNA-binding protein